MKKIIFATLLGAMTFSSCGIYGKYKRPEGLLVDSLYSSATMAHADSVGTLGQLAWQELFSDPILQGLIQEALTNNRDLRTSLLNIEQAGANLSAARLAYLPGLQFSPTGTISKIEGRDATKTYSLPIEASWQIDLFGSIRNSKKRAYATLLQSQAAHQAVQSRIITSVASAYYSLVLLDEQIRLSEETVRLWGESVRTMKEYMLAGRVNDAAVSSSEANYSQIQISLAKLRQQRLEAENAMALLLGRAQYSEARGSFDGWRTPESLSVALPLQLLSHRPDVAAAEAALVAAFYNTAAAKSAFYPSLTLSGSAGWTNNLGVIVNPAQFIASAVGSLVQPLFSRGRLVANHKVAKSQQEAARLAFEQALLSAGVEVNNLLAQVETTKELTGHYATRTKALQRAEKATRLLMQTGGSTYLELLTAQQALISGQLEESAGRLSEISAVISLYQALGGGTAFVNAPAGQRK